MPAATSTSTPPPSPTPRSTDVATPPPSPTRKAAPTATPRPTDTATPGPTPTPPLPQGGPLPAAWTEVPLGLPAGDTFRPGAMAYEPDADLLYLLGRCALEPDPRDGLPAACLAALDPETGRVVRRIPAPGGPDHRLTVVDEVLYLYPPWSGTAYALDAGALAEGRVVVLEAYPDLTTIAGDGRGAVYALSREALHRLSPIRSRSRSTHPMTTRRSGWPPRPIK